MLKFGNLEVYGIIYGIENKINGKWYIGQTTRYHGFKDRYGGENIQAVHKYHKSKQKNGRCNEHLLYSIEKYGFEVFVIHHVIDYAFSREELDIKEKSWILIKDSLNNGYNGNEGGDCQIRPPKYTDEQIKLVKQMLVDVRIETNEIAEKTGVPRVYINQVSQLYIKSNICPELNDIILKRRRNDYSKEFLEEHLYIIEEMWSNGLSEEEIIKTFPPEAISGGVLKRLRKYFTFLRTSFKGVLWKQCEECGEWFKCKNNGKGNGQKYCKECAKTRENELRMARYYKNKDKQNVGNRCMLSRKEKNKLKEEFLKEIENEILNLYLNENMKFTNIYKLFQEKYKGKGITPENIKDILIKNEVYKGKYK
jgi:hypothetical protein